MLTDRPQTTARSLRARRRGFSLVEVMVVLTVVAVMVAMSAPSFQRAVESSQAEIAFANLRAIWAAERTYWLEKHEYATDLSTLVSCGLLDSAVTGATGKYNYSFTGASDGSTFSAMAERASGSGWSGYFTIDSDGQITGSVTGGRGYTIAPGALQ